jgi:hypothetical protein
VQRSQISQLIQMGSIGISDTTSVVSPCHPEELAHCRPSSGRTSADWPMSALRPRSCHPLKIALRRSVMAPSTRGSSAMIGSSIQSSGNWLNGNARRPLRTDRRARAWGCAQSPGSQAISGSPERASEIIWAANLIRSLEHFSVTRQFPDEATFLNPRISGQNPSVDFRFWHLSGIGVWPNVHFAPTAVVRGPGDADFPTRKLRQMTPRVDVHTLQSRFPPPAGSHHTRQAQ